MPSFSYASTQYILSHCSFVGLSCPVVPSLVFSVGSRRRMRREGGLVFYSGVVVKGNCFQLGCDSKNRIGVRCKGGWDGEGDLTLEAEILEFMKNSEKPDVFPSRKQLIAAGRLDLAEAVTKHGGWLSMGWDLDDEEVQEKGEILKGIEQVTNWGMNMATELDNRSFRPTGSSSSSTSSSGRPLEASENNTGIEGILSRLEKERNINFGFSSKGKGTMAHHQSNDSKDGWLVGNPVDATVDGFRRSSVPASGSSNKGAINHPGGNFDEEKSLSDFNSLSNSLKTDAWRRRSIQKANFLDKDFEAGEIAFNETELRRAVDASELEYFATRESENEPSDREKEMNPNHGEINHKQIRNHIQKLELELSSALTSLRSNADEATLRKDNENSSDDLHKLYDSWEFQENEIMNSQNRLRSIRAKLAVLEGKMALAIVDTQKIVEQKQKRIDDARRALRLLRTVCIVWPNSASDVQLTGSFDGWITQRKMQKSSSGIYSVYLKLYPGRYEMKFIVDGEWKVDPLRPIVYNSGYENNLLIIM